MPNLVGAVKLQPDDNAFSHGKTTVPPVTSGALEVTCGGLGHNGGVSFYSNNISGISVDASKSSSVFGSSDTVMPASVDTQMGLYLGRLA